MKTVYTLVALAILLMAMTLKWLKDCNIKLTEHRIEMEAHIGDTIIVGIDTLVVVNYSYIEDDFQLSDGTDVSTKFVIPDKDD